MYINEKTIKEYLALYGNDRLIDKLCFLGILKPTKLITGGAAIDAGLEAVNRFIAATINATNNQYDKIPRAELFSHYIDWCKSKEETPVSQRRFYEILRSRFVEMRTSQARFFVGLTINKYKPVSDAGKFPSA